MGMRRRAAVSVAILLAVGATACGGDSDERVVSSATLGAAVEALTTSRVVVRLESTATNSDGEDRHESVSATGVLDWRDGRADAVITKEVDGAEASTHMIDTSTAEYASVPDDRRAEFDNRAWIGHRHDVAPPELLDLDSILDQVVDDGGTVTEHGTSRVNGFDAIEYRFRTAAEDLDTASGGSSGALFVTTDGVPTRLELAFDFSSDIGDDGFAFRAALTMTLDLTDFGAPLDLPAIADDDVFWVDHCDAQSVVLDGCIDRPPFDVDAPGATSTTTTILLPSTTP